MHRLQNHFPKRRTSVSSTSVNKELLVWFPYDRNDRKDRRNLNTGVAVILAINRFQKVAVKSQGSQAGGLHDCKDRRFRNFSIFVIAVAMIAAIAEHTASIQS